MMEGNKNWLKKKIIRGGHFTADTFLQFQLHGGCIDVRPEAFKQGPVKKHCHFNLPVEITEPADKHWKAPSRPASHLQPEHRVSEAKLKLKSRAFKQVQSQLQNLSPRPTKSAWSGVIVTSKAKSNRKTSWEEILKRILEQEVSTGSTNIKKGHWNNALCFAYKRRTSISIQKREALFTNQIFWSAV